MEVGLDNILRDRETGKLGGSYMEVLAKFQSLKQANLIMNELARGWQVSGRNEHGDIFSRETNGVVEELLVEKKARRKWWVVKNVRQA